MSFTLKLEAHREQWKNDFETEAACMQLALGPTLKNLHHIGSTAIPGICAKPIIDMLGEVESLALIDARQKEIEALGYTAMGEFGIRGRRYFRKDDSAGNRSHHLHIFVSGSPHVVRHLAFRDYLRAHPDIAREYSELKQRVAGSCRGNMEAYMDGKDAFIKGVEKQALLWIKPGLNSAD